VGEFRHYQEVIDGLGRSLSLVTAPDPQHHRWLYSEALQLGHRSHPAIPTTYHYWNAQQRERGPGYLRRWVSGETVAARNERIGLADVPYVMQILRGACTSLAYLHDTGAVHGALSADSVWVTPTGRLWLLEWQWAIPRDEIPVGLRPSLDGYPVPPEWRNDGWRPTAASDQWQLAAMCFTALTGEAPPSDDIPPVKWLRPETPESVAVAIDRALLPDPDERFPSAVAMLRTADRGYNSRSVFAPTTAEEGESASAGVSEEQKVRNAVGDDYEILSRLGSGTFGTVWRARDLSLEREVALKVLHERVSRDGDIVSAFWREARLAAQLAHPAIVPIYDWDGRSGMQWYTMELAEGGSVANLVTRAGARSLSEIAQQVDLLLDGLGAAHSIGVIHRDLKPENVLIDRYHRWRLTDFGIANITGEDRADTAGTPEFSAPEQLLGEPQGPAVDYFALAAIVAYALSGKQPFSGADPKTILAQQLAERTDLSSFPEAIAEWIAMGLAASPSARYVDAQAMQVAWRIAVKQTARRERTMRRWGWLVPGRKGKS